jgi:hypothetical protein
MSHGEDSTDIEDHASELETHDVLSSRHDDCSDFGEGNLALVDGSCSMTCQERLFGVVGD